jgi:GDPmannose 4,6-dehydratase
MKKKALILGVTGQDGSYMAELLIKKNYEVHGIVRKSATGNTKNIDKIIKNKEIFGKKFFLHRGDLLDVNSLINVIKAVNPGEIYNFADQDHVSWSFAIPSYSLKTTALSAIELFEILRNYKKIKYFHPVSSNMFGIVTNSSQNEETKLNPNSIYALAKTTVYLASKMYNRIYNTHICGAIFFNHESPRRSLEYVSKKIVKGACDIYAGKQKYLYLGDIKSKIDWGYAKDYVETAWKITQKKNPNFYIIGTGKTHTVEYFVKNCFSYVGLNYKKFVRIDKKLIRPSKTGALKANISKAKKEIKYKVKTNLKGLIKIMMDEELSSHK